MLALNGVPANPVAPKYAHLFALTSGTAYFLARHMDSVAGLRLRVTGRR
jgi:hypothetical protein